LINQNLPYVVYGSIKFFQRLEVKDALAFLKVINNGDNIALGRIINVPARKLGNVTIEKILNYITKKNMTNLFEGIKKHIYTLPIHQKPKDELEKLFKLFIKYKKALEAYPIHVVLDKFLVESGYYTSIDNFNEVSRMENIKELLRGIEA
jgi:DNA helicase-2/ATP-dependent DNA helicase PcrA